MSEIAIRLDPEALANPNADLRELLSSALVERAPELLAEDCFDYDAKDRMIVFLTTAKVDLAVAVVVAALKELEILGNRFTAGVTVAVADESYCNDLGKYRIVAPIAAGTLAST
jgi:hypothetical protein